MGVPSGKLLIAGLRSKKFAREVPGFKCRPIGSLCSVLPVGFPFDSTKNNLDYQKGQTRQYFLLVLNGWLRGTVVSCSGSKARAV